MRTKIIATLMCAGCFAVAGQAAAQYGPGPGYGYGSGPAAGYYGRPARPAQPPQLDEAEAEGPAALLRDGVNKLIGFMEREEQPGEEELARFLDREIAPFFDFEYMTQVAAGPVYRYMTDEQRERMAGEIEVQFLGTLAARLGVFGEQQVRFVNTRLGPDGRTASATIAVVNPGTYPARIDFRFYNGKSGWKVYDVAANGQSAVAHYRREFRRMTQGGPRGGFGPSAAPMRGYR
jgi:phospholipid transport system substrate-binding protein